MTTGTLRTIGDLNSCLGPHKKENMKKLIIIGVLLLGLALQGLAQTDVINPGMSGTQTRNALNTAFSELLGVVDTVNETIRIGGVQITSNAAEVNILDGALVNVTELNRLVGLPGNIITLLAGKENSLGNPGTNGYVLSSTTAGVRSWIAPGGGAVYPEGSGIPTVVSGTSWGTTITNNSANWNTAYSWGNHAGLYLPLGGTAAAVTGFTRNGGTLTLTGADALTLNTTAATNVTLPTSGTMIGSATYEPDRVVVDGTNVHLFEGSDTLYNPPPYDMRDDAATLFPTIQSAAGDTSNYTVPDKIGDLYIDTSTGDAYYSSTSARNGWRSMGDRTTISTGTVVDATGITNAMFSRFIYYSEAAATNITADPQIANGSAGQLITIIGSSDTNTLTLDDGAGLRLTGQMVLGIGDNITLLYESTIGDWTEISRSNN